ncbi:hypothetical protein, partial [Caulobacter sp.]|uniref:hypothetical protein n=1 Tax=Caulobacter sp. TaxID=78 RepID=UPI001B0AF7EA
MEVSPPSPFRRARPSQALALERWRSRGARLLGALVIHLLPVAGLLVALPSEPKASGAAFGQSVTVTLVSGAPTRTSTPNPSTARHDLAALEQRLSDKGLAVAEPLAAAPSTKLTRLSELFDAPAGGAGQVDANARPRLSAGGDDDPFARASVSYRGDDPVKAARLNAKARRCTQGAGAMRLLLIINSEGYLVAKPRRLGQAGSSKAAAKTIDAIERCAP